MIGNRQIVPIESVPFLASYNRHNATELHTINRSEKISLMIL